MVARNDGDVKGQIALATHLDPLEFPKVIVSDNGPEFVGRTLGAWEYRHGVELRFIRPGKPIENADVDSFNGRFRDECLNEHWFLGIAEAQQIIEAWRIDYSTVRPHRSLNQQHQRPTPQPPARAPPQGGGPQRIWGAGHRVSRGVQEILRGSL